MTADDADVLNCASGNVPGWFAVELIWLISFTHDLCLRRRLLSCHFKPFQVLVSIFLAYQAALFWLLLLRIALLGKWYVIENLVLFWD